MLSLFLKYFHTLRHLRPVQIYGRLWHRLYRPKPDLRPAPSLRSCIIGDWVHPPQRSASMIGPRSFRFLNAEGTIENKADWNSAAKEKLWLYNLHYFDDLNANEALKRTAWHQALIDRWIIENPPGHGNGWEPYPTSLRIVNWVKWALADNTLKPEWVASLAVQVRWLQRRLEYHLLGNHLFANAKALVFAGLFFDGSEAEQWYKKGMKILSRESREQFLNDGGHFELSPMYHQVLFEDVLDMMNLHRACGRDVPSGWLKIATGMLCWSQVMRHPDQEIAFFNDAATGGATEPAATDWYAERLGIKPDCNISACGSITHLADSGYIRVSDDSMVAILDVARIGPDYLPGHAHADTLSFELSLFGQRLFVNSGTSVYGAGAERLRQRGTAAHNTVIVDHQDSSDVWGSFRVARRARPFDLSINQVDGCEVSCSHNGYQHLRGSPVPTRTWQFKQNLFVIEDQVSGVFGVAEARFHLHPDVRVSVDKTGMAGQFRLGEYVVGWRVGAGAVRIDKSTWHPQFGMSEQNECLVVILDKGTSRLSLDWS